jgi:hypothetical protein
MKGISYWFWVVAGIIAGLVIFTLAYQQISQMSIAATEQRSNEQFLEIRDIANNLCMSFSGNTRQYEVQWADTVNGVYAGVDKHQSFTKDVLVQSILLTKNSTGNFLCIDMQDKRLDCEEITCNITSMPFMGSVPEQFSLSSLISSLMGRGKVFNYRLNFERTAKGVEIANIVPSQTFCVDGTLLNTCSNDKPKYCDNGNLVNDCQKCGCSKGTCQADGTCQILPSCNCPAEFNVTAASGSAADIQAAVNQVDAAGGGTVYIPAGTFYWNGETVNIPNGGVNLIGASMAGCSGHESNWDSYQPTTILHNIQSGPMINVGSQTHGQKILKSMRISGIQFEAIPPATVAQEDAGGATALYLRQIPNFRIDHNTFINWASSAISITANDGYGDVNVSSYGVIDHNVITNPYKLSAAPDGQWAWAYGIIMTGSYRPNDQNLLQNWDQSAQDWFGYYGPKPESSVVYVEDNHMSLCRHDLSSNGGAFYTSRFNLIDQPACRYTAGAIDVHGAAFPSGRGMVTYNNTIYGASNNQVPWPAPDRRYYSAAVDLRGGSSLVYNNTFLLDTDSPYNYFLLLSDGDYVSTLPFMNISQTYVWGNTYVNSVFSSVPSSIILNRDYFTREPTQAQDGFTYTPYPYPHPRTQCDCIQTCSDGTAHGQCSSTNPNYCGSSGHLTPNCQKCGCSTGTCQSDGTCSTTGTLSPLHVDGNKIKYSNGSVVHLHGVNKVEFADDPDGIFMGNTYWDDANVKAELAAMKSWGVNLVRCHINIQDWIKNTSDSNSAISAQEALKRFAQFAAQDGIYVIYDGYSVTDYWNGANQDPLPYPPYQKSSGASTVITSQQDFVNWWVSVANVFKDYPNVIFELWNEPYGDSTAQASYKVVAQQSINAIRATGASNLILFQWDMSNWIDLDYPPPIGGQIFSNWIPYFSLTDPTGNLVYSTHLYYNSIIRRGNSSINGYYGWNSSDIYLALKGMDYYSTAQTYPVIIGEVGCDVAWGGTDLTSEETSFDNKLSLLDSHEIGYAAFWWRGIGIYSLHNGPPDFIPNRAGQILIKNIAAV